MWTDAQTTCFSLSPPLFSFSPLLAHVLNMSQQHTQTMFEYVHTVTNTIVSDNKNKQKGKVFFFSLS